MNDKLNEIKAEKAIVLVTGESFDQAKDYAKILTYHIDYIDPITREAILLP